MTLLYPESHVVHEVGEVQAAQFAEQMAWQRVFPLTVSYTFLNPELHSVHELPSKEQIAQLTYVHSFTQ